MNRSFEKLKGAINSVKGVNIGSLASDLAISGTQIQLGDDSHSHACALSTMAKEKNVNSSYHDSPQPSPRVMTNEMAPNETVGSIKQNQDSDKLQDRFDPPSNENFVVNTSFQLNRYDLCRDEDFLDNILFQSPNETLEGNGTPSNASVAAPIVPGYDMFSRNPGKWQHHDCVQGTSVPGTAIVDQIIKGTDYNLDKRVHGGRHALMALQSLQVNDILRYERTDEVSFDGIEAMMEADINEGEGSHCSYLQGSNSGSPPSLNVIGKSKQPSEELPLVTIKAKYQGDMVRFKLGEGSTYQEMMDEVGKRFKLKLNGFDLKYLDDDDEWVMLTCDADVSECFNIVRSSGANHVKLTVRDAVGRGTRSSGESTSDL